MESLVAELEAAHHSIALDESTPGLSVKAVEFDFIAKERPPRMRVEPQMILNTDHKCLWKVRFDPPLKKGEKVKYAFKKTMRNNRPYTYEEALERIKRGGVLMSTQSLYVKLVSGIFLIQRQNYFMTSSFLRVMK
jgi:hypothetical protein